LLDVPGDEDFIKCAPCGAVQNAKGRSEVAPS
jgi:DNA-directed RNA polymerase I subunit RPA12